MIMRSIPGTITAYPAADHPTPNWVYAGTRAVFFIGTSPSYPQAEVLHGIEQVVRDLLHPEVVVQAGGTLVADVRYTTKVENVNRVLANVAEHYGIPDIEWLSGVKRVGKSPASPEEVN